MWVLALDTTTRGGSTALVHDGVVVRETAGDPAVSHAARTPGDFIDLLEREAVALEDVDAFAVAVGPGSFTGLRVGIAAMQGVAFAEKKPLVGISALDALAQVVGVSETVPSCVATWVDAWRTEVFAACYSAGTEVEPPTVEEPGAVLARLHGEVTFIGDGAATYEALIRDTLGPGAHFWTPMRPLLAGVIGTLAWGQLRAGHRPGPDAIRPLYVRRPDAELAQHGRR